MRGDVAPFKTREKRVSRTPVPLTPSGITPWMTTKNAFHEILSFMVVSNPCCPLPIVTLQPSTGENKLACSADLHFEMMNQGIQSASNLPESVKLSMNQQKTDLRTGLYSSLTQLDTGCPVTSPPDEWTEASREKAYAIMSKYFRDLVAVYTTKPDNDIRIPPMHSIHHTSPINHATADHFNALRDVTRMGRPEWNKTTKDFSMELSLESLRTRPYWFNVCLHAHKIRLEEAKVI